MKTKTIPTVRLLLTILMCLPVWGSRLSAKEPYAVYDKTTSTLTFKYGTKPAGAYALNEGDQKPEWQKFKSGVYPKKVVFDASFANARPTSCYMWFYLCGDIRIIEGIEYLNTENVTNMESMFHCCDELTTLDLSTFDTRKVTNMKEMFSSCENLTTINLSSFNTENVTNMESMFHRCDKLTTLDLSSFNTKKVTNMRRMFYDCSRLTTINLSSFNTENVTNMESMFNECCDLTTINLSGFNTQNVTNMGWMFFEGGFTTLDLSSFDTKNVTIMRDMFTRCYSLTTIYASEKFVTTDEWCSMFDGCKNLVGAVPYAASKVGNEMANYTTGYFTYKAATGIDAPTVSDDTAAEYYDLQGRRLNAPQKGVNIVKRGKKTTKMLVK